MNTPKPTALKVVQGTFRKDRSEANEPLLPVCRPDPADYLDDEARDFHAELVDVLELMQVVTLADRAALSAIADVWSELSAYRSEIELHGLTIEGVDNQGNKKLKANPAVAMRADAWRRLMSGLQQFGLTPSSRTKVAAIKKMEKKSDPWSDL